MTHSRKKPQNVFYDDRGFPNESEDYNSLLHTIDSGNILRRTKFLTPPLNKNDPTFNFAYSEELHGEKLRSNLDVLHLPPKHVTALLNLIKEYWCVFDNRGTLTPV
jgi:hypothetical protein